MLTTKIGIIGGSGIYDISGVQNGKWEKITTPFGKPSDELFTGALHGIDIAFLPRHGRGHQFSPSSVPYLANIYALKSIGVTDIVSFSAVGSLRADYKPGELIIIDQFIDRTFSRQKSFFTKGCVAHVSMAVPVCDRLSTLSKEVLDYLNLPYHSSGTYLAMEGPQFSTLAESQMYKNSWGCDVIGMTNMPEAKLIREAEICYTSIGMVTDFDCWHPGHKDVEVSEIIKTASQNVIAAKSFINRIVQEISKNRTPCVQGCDVALENAIISDKSKIDAFEKKRMPCITDRILSN